MKQQMTPAEKVQYFALYWEQKVVKNDQEYPSGSVHVSSFTMKHMDSNNYLSLRSIEQITDEEAVSAYCLETGEKTDDWPDEYMIRLISKISERPFNFR